MNINKLKKATSSIIEAIGEDPEREGLKDTPRRVADMYAELFAGLKVNPTEELKTGFEQGHREMVIVRDIPFYSMCEHHLLPFFGIVHVGYIPNKSGRIVGISKIARVVDIIARRPQVQERLTTDIADTVMEGLKPSGVAVVVKAEHMCMIMRGVKKPGSSIITSAIRGSFLKHDASRAEFFSLIQNK
ncbi:MAG: GTP cyclohydrolase I FolE [Dehalococcoidales bacterium]|nr:GTP cyclohydrolase I FolE [Dehalococcoidales bacterium]